jgi:Tol biopolymer transport system component
VGPETKLLDYIDRMAPTVTADEVTLRPPSTSPFRMVRLALLAALIVGVVLGIAWLRSLDTSRTPVTQPPNDQGFANGWVAYSAQSIGDSTNPESPNLDIFVVRDGEVPRRIAGWDGDGLDQMCPRFSPDGTMLAYTEYQEGLNPWDVVVVPFDGGTAGPELLRVEATSDECMTWSPDSSRLAFVARRPGSTGMEGERDQYLLKVTTLDGQEATLFDRFGGHKDVDWSPAGSVIAVKGSTQSTGDAVWLVQVDGSGSRLLVRANPSPGQPTAWSPDGSKIVLSQWLETGDGLGGLIRIVNAEGSGEHSIAVSELAQGEGFDFSPDGTRFAYLDWPDQRVVIVESDGSNPVKLHPIELPPAAEPAYIFPVPIWSPDGESILVTVGWPRSGAIVVLSVDPEDPPTVIANGLAGVENDGGATWQVVSR